LYEISIRPEERRGIIFLPALNIFFSEVTSTYRGVDKSLARPTSWCILIDGENISLDASLVIYINSTNIP
jgi:hypothetical protein